MIQNLTSRRAWRALVFVFAAVVMLAGCGARNPNAIPANTAQPDRFLFDRGTEALNRERWLDAREYFRQIVDNYPNSALRADAKLGVGDAYMGEGGPENLILAANEYREFLTFYPTHARADYAQYKLAMTHHQQMRAPQRDQTETREALREFQVFFDRYPNSPLTPEVRQKWREARDRLSEYSYLVGLHYYRSRWYPGALSRFREVLQEDPQYTHRDDVYFYIAEALSKANTTAAKAEAVTYYDRILKEFQESEHLEDARKRIQELQGQSAQAQELKTQ